MLMTIWRLLQIVLRNQRIIIEKLDAQDAKLDQILELLVPQPATTITLTAGPVEEQP